MANLLADEAVITGCEAAWAFYGGIFRLVIPDNLKAVVVSADPVAARLNDVFVEYAQVRCFVVDPARVRHAKDNAACESWIATIKCERLYDADTAEMTPEQVESMIDRFIDHYNTERLHQAIDYVTPAERHDGRHTAIIEARKQGMQEAKRRRRMDAYGGQSGETDG